jgi:general secretion pathway protein L
MAEILVIRLPEIADRPAHWIAVDSSGARRSPPVTGPLHEALVDVGDRKVVVLVPSAEVLTTSVEIPVKGGARLLAALPYALEELLADDIDKLHFAAGARRPSGRVPVSVVSKAKLAEWRQRLADAGIRPSSIVSENYGLARIPGTISMLIADEQILINDGAEIELTMQDVSPGDALAAIGALDDGHEAADAEDAGGLRNMPRHVLVYCEPGDEERYEHDWLAIRHELDSLDINLLPDGVMPRLAVTVATGSGMNLLQGEYAARKEFSGLLRPWKFAAMLLVAFIGVGVAAKAIEYYSLTRQETALRELFQREYSALAPNAAEVRDPTAVVASLRARAGRSESPQVFLESLTTLSRALGANDAARLDAISYRSGVVDLRLTAPDVVTLDNIQRVIAEDGRFTASIQSTDQVDDHVNSRMQVQVRTP